MIRIAVVEDEEYYVNQLTGYLNEYQKTEKKNWILRFTGTEMRSLRNISRSLTLS